MNIEEAREFCLSLPYATEDMPFGEDHLVFRIMNKIFACMSFNLNGYLTMKCDPEYAMELRERYLDIQPAWHWNKKYWNQVRLEGNLPREFIESLIFHSFKEVVKKLPKRVIDIYPEINELKKI